MDARFEFKAYILSLWLLYVRNNNNKCETIWYACKVYRENEHKKGLKIELLSDATNENLLKQLSIISLCVGMVTVD